MVDNDHTSAFCRCCHTEGNFKSLQEEHTYRGQKEVYDEMILEAFGISLQLRTTCCYTICDECVVDLRRALQFKQMVLANEAKLEQSWNTMNENESIFKTDPLIETIKEEKELEDNITINDEFVYNSDEEVPAIQMKCEIDHCKDEENDHVKMNNVNAENNETAAVKRKRTVRRCVKIDSGVYDPVNKLYKCQLCDDRVYKSKSAYIKHKQDHDGTRRLYPCDICGHQFKDVTNLRKHIDIVHHKQRRYNCDVCRKTFTLKKHLTVHLRFHTGETPFKCKLCPDGFVTGHKLLLHSIRNHGVDLSNNPAVLTKKRSKLAPRVCDICGQIFSSQYVLMRHRNSHLGIQKYECVECNKKYYQKNGLIRHNNAYHNPDKPVARSKEKCDICKQSFIDIVRHKKSHLVRPYSCARCPLNFAYRNALNRHVRIVHLGHKAHCCEVCDKKYTSIGNLRNHRLKKHNIGNENEDGVKCKQENDK